MKIAYSDGEHICLKDVYRCADREDYDFETRPLLGISCFYKMVSCEHSPKIIKDELKLSNPIWFDHEFKEDFELGMELIDKGHLNKAVIYNTLEFDYEGILVPETILANLGQIQQGHHVYGQWQKNVGMIGISPELIFEQKDAPSENYVTEAIAGTSKDYHALEQMIFQQEQKIVLEHIEDALKKLNLAYHIDEKKIINYDSLFHLKSSVSFETSLPAHELINIIGPTPAVALSPKEKLHEYWNQFLFSKRLELYGGIFHINLRSLNKAIVMIRGMSWNENKVKFHAGCGIIKGSQYKSELLESKNKIETVLAKLYAKN